MMNIDDLMAAHRDDVRALIAETSDVALLTEWFSEAQDQAADLRDEVDSFKAVGTAEWDWLRRVGGRLSHLTKVKRWSADRLLTLGITPPWPPSDPRLQHIRRLEARGKTLVAALRSAGVVVPGEEVSA